MVEDLKEILKGRTALIVSQRLSLVKLTDRVIVIKDGRIIEEGKPSELVKKGGAFSEMIRAIGEEYEK